MNGLEISGESVWKAIGAGLVVIMGLVQAMFWRWLKLEKKETLNQIAKSAGHVEKTSAAQVRRLEGSFRDFKENDFRDFKEISTTRINVLESLRGEDVRRFDAFDKKLDLIQEKADQSTKDLRQDIQRLSQAVMEHISHGDGK